MCGVFGISKDSLDYKYMSQWNIQTYLDWTDRYNIRPTQSAPIIYQTVDGNKLELAKFGLIPSWSKTDKIEYPTFNARSETVDKLPTYKKPFKEKRCLIPVDFFYEFAKTAEGSIPYLFKLKNHNGPFWLAGIYDINQEATDKPIISFSIVTTPANDIVGNIHPRMPAILPLPAAKKWINLDYENPETLKILLKPFPDKLMELYQVSKLVNNFRNEGPGLIQPVD